MLEDTSMHKYIQNSKFKIQNSKFLKENSGITLLEMLIAIGIFAILFGFITLNLPSVLRSTSVNSSVVELIGDMRGQQEKAMNGAGNGASGSNFGIYFQTDRYILFTGASYSAADPANFTVMLDKSITITNDTFPSSTLDFTQRSGTPSGFIAGSNTFVVKNSTGNQQKTIRVNRFGTIDQIN